MFNKKKYSCCFCNDLTKISTSKVSFCRECNKLRQYLREWGINALLRKIQETDNKPSCPPY